METVAYYIALITILTFPPAILFWMLVHPLAARWREIGAAKTYLIILPTVTLCGWAIYLIREPILEIRFGVNLLLSILALILFALAMYIGLLRARHFKVSTLVGIPELSSRKGPGELITSGIFSRVRHPRYIEGGLGLAATALFCNYLAIYVLLLFYFPLIYLVVILEERELRQRFGGQYEEYCREVPRFLPKTGRRKG